MITLANGKQALGWSSSQYVQNAVNNVEDYLKAKGKTLPKKANAPLSSDYRPDLDTSPELDLHEAAHYQSLIGIL